MHLFLVFESTTGVCAWEFMQDHLGVAPWYGTARFVSAVRAGFIIDVAKGLLAHIMVSILVLPTTGMEDSNRSVPTLNVPLLAPAKGYKGGNLEGARGISDRNFCGH